MTAGFVDIGLFEATAIGSLPHRDPARACEVVLEALPSVPHWPQLPARDPREDMIRQFLEGMPGVVESEDGVYLRPPSEVPEQWEGFLRKVEEGRSEAFSINRERAEGLYAFLDRVRGLKPPFLKGQVTGPVTMGFSLKDEGGRAAFYDEELREMIVRVLASKARWQEEVFKEAVPSAETIIFFDEPALAGYGSAYMNVRRQEVIDALKGAMADLGGLKGIHVCANTDWPMVLEAGFDIVNFDAHGYREEFLLWTEQIGEFLRRGGIIAWGIVPTDAEALKGSTPSGLAEDLRRCLEHLEASGVEGELLRRSLITPSCGTGSLTEAEAEEVYRLLRELRRVFGRSHG